MRSRLVFCTGVLRSGSTWSFNVCRLIGQQVAKQSRLPFASVYLTPDQTDAFIRKQGGAVPGPAVIKVHALGALALETLAKGQAVAVCTYRDPRDCVASMMTFTGDSFEAAVGRIRGAIAMLDLYGQNDRTLFIRYEDMLADRFAQVKKIAAHLGAAIDESALRKIDDETGIEHSKEICEQLKDRPKERVLISMDHRVDPDTSLHDNHIQSGKFGRWKDEMSEEQIRVLEQTFRPWLDRFGYGDQ